MSKYICNICGYVFEDDPKKNQNWNDLPEDWTCPLCGAGKDAFSMEKGDNPIIEKNNVPLAIAENEFSHGLLSAIFSNLARGSEKQYLESERKLFLELATYFNQTVVEDQNIKNLISEMKFDLDYIYPQALELAKLHHDRGALRALVWSEKVTKILMSILNRFIKNNDLNETIHVCDICGFVYLGEDIPPICPICKVPNHKFSLIERSQ